jgi:protease I
MNYWIKNFIEDAMSSDKNAEVKIACIATDGFEFSELAEPVAALRHERMRVDVLSPDGNEIRGWSNDEWSDYFKVDGEIKKTDPNDYDGLLIPGGTINCDSLRQDAAAVRFVRHFIDAGKPISAICHGLQLLIEADGLEGKEVTSYPAIRKDVENAGAHWHDKEAVVDNGLTTSRSPKDLPSFIARSIEEFNSGTIV